MKKGSFAIVLLVLIFSGCEQENKETGPLVNYDFAGVAQKGPFTPGTKIKFIGLDNNLQPTGEEFDTETIDRTGRYQANVLLASPFIELVAEGYFYREIPGNIHREPLAINSIIKANEKPDNTNINLLTWFKSERIRHLVQNDGLSFEDANSKSYLELINVLGFPNEQWGTFEHMDITSSTKDDALLFAASCWATELNYTNSDSTLNSIAYLSDRLNKKMISFRTGELKELGGSGRASDLLKVRESLEKYLGRELPEQLDFTRIANKNYSFRVENIKLKTSTVTTPGQEIDPVNILGVDVTFNMPVDLNSLNDQSLILTDGTQPVGYSITQVNPYKVTFVPDHYLKAGTNYSVTFSPGITNEVNGLPLDTDITFNFATSCAPTVMVNKLANTGIEVEIGSQSGDEGTWTILRGSGGSFGDETKSLTVFRGHPDETYTLRWTMAKCAGLVTDIVVSFTGRVVDYEGNVYGSTRIGDQVWMSENLRSVYNASGEFISEVTTFPSTPHLKLYPWYIALNKQDSSTSNPSGIQGVCPNGWHLPSQKEFKELLDFLATDGRRVDLLLRDHESWDGINSYGFNAIKTGGRLGSSISWESWQGTAFWTTVRKPDSTEAQRLSLIVNNTVILGFHYYDMNWSQPVRCVRD